MNWSGGNRTPFRIESLEKDGQARHDVPGPRDPYSPNTRRKIVST